MRGFFVLLCLCCWTPAAAQDDSEVMEAYRAYNQAVEQGKQGKTRKLAQQAYEKAEEYWGASRPETGKLATNYANELSKNKYYHGKAIEIYERCAEIFAGLEASHNPQAYCLLGAAAMYRSKKEFDNAKGAYRRTIDVSEAFASTDKEASGYAGEAYLGLAYLTRSNSRPIPTPRGTIASGETGTRIREKPSDATVDMSGYGLAEKALERLEFGYGRENHSVASAYRLLGNYAEAEENYIAAVEHYRHAYEILRNLLGADDPMTEGMRGRMLFVQVSLRSIEKNRKEPTREPSTSKCNVVVRQELEIEYCYDVRFVPFFPNQAYYKGQSGFVLVGFNITESGKVETPHIISSWPGGIFDERAIKSIKKWRYFPPTDQNGNIVAAPDLEVLFKFVIG